MGMVMIDGKKYDLQSEFAQFCRRPASKWGAPS